METRTIAGELTIYTAAMEKQSLQEALDAAEELEINLSQVNEMDSAGLQVLIVLKQEAARRKKKLHYSMHSKAVLEILEMSNMTTSFGDQIVRT